jgi:hypothetical protein
MSKDELASVSFWAVGRLPKTAHVAIKINDFPPIVMSPEEAREIAAALKGEAHASTVARVVQSAKQSAQSLKK